ncbi:hypothetical protein BU17DRAFT_70790 [Hysterangium stoloniferum]|nr:hypothetical protein BU17DRAFT_70790 [Hysterangium stoloniferum]
MLARNWIAKISTLCLDIPYLYRNYSMRIYGLQNVHDIQEREVFDVVGYLDEGQSCLSTALYGLRKTPATTLRSQQVNKHIGLSWAATICSTMGCRLLLNIMKCWGDPKTNTRRRPPATRLETMNIHPSRSWGYDSEYQEASHRSFGKFGYRGLS